MKCHASELEILFLHKRVGRFCGNAAHIVLVANHQDVSHVSPVDIPRVLDDPVVCALLVSAVAHNQYCVVQMVHIRDAVFVLVNSCTNKTFIVSELNGSHLRRSELCLGKFLQKEDIYREIVYR